MKHVQHVRGRWVARMTVPEELRPILNMRELVAPLGTDKRQAERQALAVLNRFHAILDEAREAYEAGRPTLTSAAKLHYQAELVADDRERLAPGGANDFMKASRPVYANRLRLALSGTDGREELEALVGYAADDLAGKGFAPDVPRHVLLRALAEVQLDALARFQERDDGRVKPGEPASPLLTAPDPEPAVMAPAERKGGPTLSDLLGAFHNERSAGGRSLAQKTMDEHKGAVRMFEEFLGQTVPVRSITKQKIIAYKQALLETPTRYTLRFKGLMLPQAIKANKKREKPFETLDPQTINMKWLSHLSSILQWGANNGFIDINPALGVRVDTGSAVHKEPTRLPFDQEELQRIFGHPMFNDPSRYETRQWAVLMALYTGARSSSEFRKIKLADVREEQGVPVFDLREATKNRRSKRLVPIHKDLLQIGLLAYVAKLRSQNESRLFPDWEPEDKVNNWFLRTFRKTVGIMDARKVFHSFRHNLKTELVRSGCTRELADLIAGHEDQSAAAVYIHEAPIKRMKEALDRVDFRLPIPILTTRSTSRT
ncbi:tyrosine-type recombinase/integrase [Paracoccus sp. S-4012]|uniref:site-specific integrase n=1 Tax=Paracoccus sp. S-4012 TaxID=2665648 RepID=UPI0012AFAE01|nr:site-specific integrase [Paracoccus sp. S-4012]MRX51328.1 tyrosine-type recombinase/integrase [Paracoccus sp. S-4012]